MPRKKGITHTFDEMLAQAKARLLKQVSETPTRSEREALEAKIAQLESAARWNAMLSAPPAKQAR